MPGGRLPEKGKKTLCQISGLKSGCSRLKYLRSGRLQESFWTVFHWGTKRLFTKWLHVGRGHLWEVVTSRELTVLMSTIQLHWFESLSVLLFEDD